MSEFPSPFYLIDPLIEKEVYKRPFFWETHFAEKIMCSNQGFADVPRISIDAEDFNENVANSFDKYGFVVVENVFGRDEVAQMQSAMERIVDRMNPEEHPKSVFSTEFEKQVLTFIYENIYETKRCGQFSI